MKVPAVWCVPLVAFLAPVKPLVLEECFLGRVIIFCGAGHRDSFSEAIITLESSLMTRVFIYGSCVTRDAEPWFKDFDLEMVGYSARQSLLSAFRRADSLEFNLAKISSKFQRRMAKNDIEGNLRFELRRSKPDVILWDICDERLNVRKLPSGGMITQSRNYVAEGIHPGPLGPRFKFGEDPHFDLWSRGLEQLLEVLDLAGLTGKLYLNATPWALVDEFGEDHEGQADAAREFNKASERYLDLAWRKGAKVVLVPQEESISRTEGHSWGPAPFHYADATYIRMLEELKRSMAEN